MNNPIEAPPLLSQLLAGDSLDEATMAGAVGAIMDGEWSPVSIASFLTALRMRGETVDELSGAVAAMRSRATRVRVDSDIVLDTCGTGGDGASTFNISTTVAFVAAAAGVPVAKHGNRSVSSRSGSADVLESLGVRIDGSPATVERCIVEVGIGFLFAPAHHNAMRHAAPIRRELGFRTLFNLVGPLTNPAGASHQLVGIFDPERLHDVASVLHRGGAKRALVVHGSDGLDEITLSGPTHAVHVIDGALHEITLHPEQAGVPCAPSETLKGGGPDENAAITRAILAGTETGPRRDVVRLNAGAALWIAEAAPTLADGVALATTLLDDGSALACLDGLVAASNREDACPQS
jgi:anthranilate phosphoribosyltransferase